MEAKITKIMQGTMMDPVTKASVPAIAVTYTVGDHGPFVETMPKDAYNPGTVKQKIAAMIEHVRQTA